MEDANIVQLYWDRNEQAITESSSKYGAYCQSIARNILADRDDAEECVNDTWLHAWDAMPPHRPNLLSAFLGKITRNLSFDRYRTLHRDKRGGHGVDLVLDELGEIVSGSEDPARSWEAKELRREIDRFLASLSPEKRHMFVRRYWYADPVSSIARRFRISENNVSAILSRIRKKLRADLEERGYDL